MQLTDAEVDEAFDGLVRQAEALPTVDPREITLKMSGTSDSGRQRV